MVTRTSITTILAIALSALVCTGVAVAGKRGSAQQRVIVPTRLAQRMVRIAHAAAIAKTGNHSVTAPYSGTGPRLGQGDNGCDLSAATVAKSALQSTLAALGRGAQPWRMSGPIARALPAAMSTPPATLLTRDGTSLRARMDDALVAKLVEKESYS